MNDLLLNVALLLILNTSVLAGIMPRAGVLVLCAIFSISTATIITARLPIASSSTNFIAHFRCTKIRNSFFVQAEFFDLLFHFVKFLILKTGVLAGVMTGAGITIFGCSTEAS
jgi:hypothetical protein